MKAIRVVVHGSVHGVFYRQTTLEKATEFRLKGTVKNCIDGTVEIFAEGDEKNLQQLTDWCHAGPPRAKVTRVDIHEAPLKNFSDFRIIH